LSPDERDRLLGHIASCADCREVYMLMAAADDVSVEPVQRPVSSARPARRRMLQLALAACIAVVAVSAYVYTVGFETSKESAILVAKTDAAKMEPQSPSAMPPMEDVSDGNYYRELAEAELSAPQKKKETAPPPTASTQVERKSAVAPAFSDMPVPAGETNAVSGIDADEGGSVMSVMPKAEPRPLPHSEPPAGAGEEMPVMKQKADKAAESLAGSADAGRDMEGVAEPSLSSPVVGGSRQADTIMSNETGTRTAQLKKAEGELKSIDRETGEVVLRPIGATEDIKIKAADPETLDNFRVGDMVKVEYEEGDVNLASRIKKRRTVAMPVGC
jgi:hypothetical protein